MMNWYLVLLFPFLGFLEKPLMKLVRKNRNLNEYERLSNITLRSEGTALLLLFTEWMHIYIGIQGVFFYV
jgi:hypothetical protein